jgi:hypothetical protein
MSTGDSLRATRSTTERTAVSGANCVSSSGMTDGRGIAAGDGRRLGRAVECDVGLEGTVAAR